ncbi:GAF and ANTAR domain-containing protein [Micromonospora siamensis]|uniref:GAF domain-containing protein n=1 Tax=Micromonospora siamensis TaxID=299152 RepID=A0A1C5H7A3_9ACTN|nr:GAF and ANTAR domain-containing protein [Micromonospora siamensis]SCG41916.1 GAF domain-containing protein [Micromonospora siamensis]
MTTPPTAADALAELGRIRLDEVTLTDVLCRLAELARRTVAGAQEVSVTLIRGESGRTMAHTGEPALALDLVQYEDGSGPCLSAAASGSSISVPDTGADERWPDWSRRAREHGVGSSLSIGLPIQEAVVGALNVYGGPPHSFDAEAVTVAESFAAYAAVALANAHLYDSTSTLAEQMREAMRSRAVIEQAKGIIMGSRRCSPDEAFALLARISQDSNRKVREVAEALVAGAVKQPS